MLAESFCSEANIITCLRLIGSLCCFVVAAVTSNYTLNIIGFLIHWIGDYIDGWYARRLKQETVFGAEIDLIADRLELIFFYVNFLHFRPYLYLPIVLYLIDYAFVDFYLSYQFNKFGIISPNYFFKVNQTVYFFNYSPGGKFVNSSVISILLIVLPHFGVGVHTFVPFFQIIVSLLAILLIAVKSWSIYTLCQNKDPLAQRRLKQTS